MSDGPDRDVPQPRPGPKHPVEATPPLGEGAVRRTTSVDMTRPDGPGGPVVIDLRGRDVLAGSGADQVLDEVRGTLAVDDRSVITGAAVDGGTTSAPDLEGLALSRGWARAVAARVPSERTLLASALEDLGGAYLVSGYAPLRAGLLGMPPEMGATVAAGQADVCIGWARGTALVELLATTGVNAVPYGPDVDPSVLAPGPWHDMADLPELAVRRIRRLDVTATDAGWGLDVHFRDTYGTGQGEMAMHEYALAASVDAEGRVAAIEVRPRVLPWDTCPGAVASAQQVVGTATDDLADQARRDLRGPTTCTHLTSTIRSLADAAHLARLSTGAMP